MQEGTDNFKRVIQAYLEEYATKDPLFAKTYNKPNKSIDDCVAYIINEVKNSGLTWFPEDEIYKMAIHYYDEDDLKGGKLPDVKVVSSKYIPPTQSELEKEKAAALEKVKENVERRKDPEKFKKIESKKTPTPKALPKAEKKVDTKPVEKKAEPKPVEKKEAPIVSMTSSKKNSSVQTSLF